MTPYVVADTAGGGFYSKTPQRIESTCISDYNGSLGGLPVLWQNIDDPAWGISDCIANVPGAIVHCLELFVHRLHLHQILSAIFSDLICNYEFNKQSP